MGIALRKHTANGPLRSGRSTSRSGQPAGLPIQRPGQHYSLSPIARHRTLPLPFDVVTSADEPDNDKPVNVDIAVDINTSTSAPDNVTTSTNSSNSNSSNSLAQVTPAAQALQAQRALVAQLSREVKRIEVAGRVQPDQLGRRSAVFSSGSASIDSCLPYKGYESGTIIEYLQNSAGSGATTLALSAAREALAVTDRFCVVVDWRRQFYPPAAAALGLDLKRIVIVRPTTLADRLWAIDQALRCPSIVAVIAEIEQLDDHAARRLQLAAESGGGLGFLVRSSQRQQPSWAEVQWLVRPLVRAASPTPAAPIPAAIAPLPHRQLQLELLRVRGGQSGSRVHIQINATNGRLEPTAAAAALARTLSRADQKPAENKARLA